MNNNSDKMPKLIIIEDEPAISASLKTALTRVGYQVTCIDNGEDGLNTAIKEKPDLILLDILLPRLDGIHALKQLRQDDWGKTAKVIIVTNVTDDKVEHEAKTLNISGYFVKSDTRINDIVDTVGTTLKLNK